MERDVHWKLHAVCASHVNYIYAKRLNTSCLELCHDKLTDADASKEEMDEELAVIATQLAFAYQLQGCVKDAKEIYQSVIELG